MATASLAGLIAFAPDPLYTLTKHAVVGLVRALAEPLRADDITVNAVCPGITDTPILSDEARGALRGAGFQMIPPSDIAAAVLACFAGRESGKAFVCQHGRPPVAYAFRGVPGPADHERPPAGLGDPDAGAALSPQNRAREGLDSGVEAPDGSCSGFISTLRRMRGAVGACLELGVAGRERLAPTCSDAQEHRVAGSSIPAVEHGARPRRRPTARRRPGSR